jgi:hypothetical protein
MRVSPATNRDFAEFRHGFFPFRKIDPHHRWPPLPAGGSKIHGLAVRSLDDSLIGLSLYEVSENLLLISEFTSFPLSRPIGTLLVNGLRAVARQHSVDLIWFSDDQGTHTESFMVDCGFKLMAYYGQRNEYRSGRTNLWCLPQIESLAS